MTSVNPRVLDYTVALPLISRLPTRLAYAAARLRGRLAASGHGDWVERTLGQRYIGTRTQQAWHTVHPQATARQCEAWARQRYETWSEEELEACWLTRGDDRRWRGLDLDPARRELASLPAGQGLVLLQAHFNNPTLACAAVGMATQRPVWMTVSGIYGDDRVHPAVRALFEGKYRGAERTLHGGRLLHSEDSAAMRQLYRALQRGEIVIVVADLPPVPGQEGVAVPWLGREREVAAGAHRLAGRTASAVGTLWLQAPSPGRWTLNVSLARGIDVLDSTRHAYAALGAQLMAHPGRWWAAHLLPDTPDAPVAHAPVATAHPTRQESDA